MRSELAERLRGANPVPATEAVAPDESLLLRIVATPHRATSCPTRRFSRRRAVTVLAAAVIVIGGIAAAATKFAPDYFGSDDREPTPAAVLAALRSYAREEPVLGGLGEIDAEGLLRVAAFDTETGRATIYVAPMRAGSGFCSVDAVDDEIRGGGCEDGTGRAAVPYMGSGSRDWGDIRVLLGRLETPAARIEVRFEDGAVRAASVRDPWWVYVVGGDETEPGLRPVELTALDPGGAVLARQELDPSYYTSQRAAEALLPEGDGSPGQNAIRAVLKGLGTGPWLEPEQLEIELTRLLRRIETRGGTLDIYAAPWGRGGICFAYVSSSFELERKTTGCPANEPIPNQPSGFDPDSIEFFGLAPSIFTVDGTPPLGATDVRVRFEDGTSARADIFVQSFFAAWFGPERLVAGHRPAELAAFDGDGREIATFPLDTER